MPKSLIKYIWIMLLLYSCKSHVNDRMIYCNCENISNARFITNTNELRFDQHYFENAESKTRAFAHSGRHAIELTMDHPYGMTYVIHHVQPKEHFNVEVLRYGIMAKV